MTPRRRAALGLTLTTALLASATAAATPSTAAASTPLPAHVYAPYYETYLAPNTPTITATAQASGARYFTLAFLQSTGKNSCALDWNGNSAQPLGYYSADIASLRAAGGDVIPSFGGFSADQGGTEIADSCASVSQIAADYESVITTLGVTRLDMDVEAKSLNNTDAQAMLSYAQAQGMNLLSVWAIQRDNGGCPGTRDSNTCSGITQGTWDFSHLLEPFTG
jgi:hypothetical protein